MLKLVIFIELLFLVEIILKYSIGLLGRLIFDKGDL